MELLTSLGSAPKSLLHLGQLCNPPTLKLEMAEATPLSVFLQKQSLDILTRSLNASIHLHSGSSLWPVFSEDWDQPSSGSGTQEQAVL